MKYTIYTPVGKIPKHIPKDVKVVQALLNVYLRQENNESIPVNGNSDKELVSLIELFQKNEVGSRNPDGRVDPGGRTWRKLYSIWKDSFNDGLVLVKPKKGLLTFETEGNEGGFFHSRILHVPGPWSGLTLGRGYDMKNRTISQINKELTKVGIPAKHAIVISRAAGLNGNAAKQFIIDNDLLDFKITPQMQLKLFEITYEFESKVAKRVCQRKDFEKNYGTCNWDKLDQRIADIIVDLKYRGEYKESTIGSIQEHIANNNFEAFKKAMMDVSNWPGTPKDRFESRKKYLMKVGASK